MKKPAELRRHLEQWVPELNKHPEKLHVFVEKGSVSSRYGKSLSWRYDYTLQLIITDFSSSPDAIVVPLLAWIKDHQPSLLLAPENIERVLQFEAEHLSHSAFDIAFTLPLSERIVVTQGSNGYRCEHLGEPPLPDLGGPVDWSINPE